MGLTPTIYLSDRSYRDILNETSQHPGTETGGVLIGEREADNWFVVESIDPGPRAVLQHSYFEYDHAYVNHLCNKVRQRYETPLKLLGLWHRHPGSFDRFSGTDDGTHRRYIRQCNGVIISALINVDPTFRITFYRVEGEPPQHQKTEYAVGDQYFPSQLLRILDEKALTNRVNRPAGPYADSSQDLRIIDKWSVASSIIAPMLNPIRVLFAEEVTAPPPQREVAPETADRVTSEALEMLDAELAYLDSQRDFAYELERSPQGVLLTMQKLCRGHENGDSVRFLFTLKSERRVVEVENQSFPYREGIVEDVIGKMFY